MLRHGRSRPGGAEPGLAKGLSLRKGADLHEMQLFIENVVLSLFWSFLDLLDVKNGSGSKFYTGKWYREVWKPKINLFRDKTMNL